MKVKRKADKKYYALKQVPLQSLTEKEKSNALREVQLLAELDHQNIIKYKEAFID